jgi:hypothetical protein
MGDLGLEGAELAKGSVEMAEIRGERLLSVGESEFFEAKCSSSDEDIKRLEMSSV